MKHALNQIKLQTYFILFWNVEVGRDAVNEIKQLKGNEQTQP
jgi:hypothetical protein